MWAMPRRPIFRARILGGVAVTPFRVEMRILTDFRDCCLQRLWSAGIAPPPTRVPGRGLHMGIAHPGGTHGPGRAPKWHCDTPAPDRGPRPRPMATPQPAPWPRPAHATHMPRRRDADAGGWRFAFYSLQRKRVENAAPVSVRQARSAAAWHCSRSARRSLAPA